MATRTVLIIDDHADTRTILSARLTKHHYNTVFAADGLQATAVARQVQPDVIILDLGLPGGSGFVVLQRLKSNTMLVGTPVIILTADESPESKLKALAAGAAAYLQKPVEEDALVAAVDGVLRRVAESMTPDVGRHR